MFTPVCHSVHRGGLVPGGGWSLGEGAWWRPPRTATAAGGTHPTGMHSCLSLYFITFLKAGKIFLKC